MALAMCFLISCWFVSSVLVALILLCSLTAFWGQAGARNLRGCQLGPGSWGRGARTMFSESLFLFKKLRKVFLI